MVVTCCKIGSESCNDRAEGDSGAAALAWAMGLPMRRGDAGTGRELDPGEPLLPKLPVLATLLPSTVAGLGAPSLPTRASPAWWVSGYAFSERELRLRDLATGLLWPNAREVRRLVGLPRSLRWLLVRGKEPARTGAVLCWCTGKASPWSLSLPGRDWKPASVPTPAPALAVDTSVPRLEALLALAARLRLRLRALARAPGDGVGVVGCRWRTRLRR